MKSKKINGLLYLFTSLLCLVAFNTNSFAAEIETPVTCVEGSTTALTYGNSTSGCSINPAIDTDLFTFSGSINEQIRINVVSTSSNMDPVLELRDSMGTLIDTGSCVNVGCTFTLDVTLPSTGTFLITLFDQGSNEAGNYIMQLEKILPAENLQRIDYDSEITDSISPRTDIDKYFFNAQPGTTIRLNAFSTSSNMDPTIELYGPDGGIVLNGVVDGASCNNVGCTFSVELAPSLDGAYALYIYDASTNEAGNYQLSLWCITGPCSSDGVSPDTTATVLNYFTPVSDGLSPATDGDFYTFNGTLGTSLRLNAFSTSSNMDPTIELRDPAGNLILDGAIDGASCNNVGCTFSVDVVPIVSGTYSIILYDSATNEAGNYQLSLWCVTGQCDSDGDGTADAAPPELSYVLPISDSISPAVNADLYTFNGTTGTSIRFNVFSTSSNMDPTIEVRDPNDTVIFNGVADGASCDNVGCTFSLDLTPSLSGTYSLLMYDRLSNEAGNYQLSLWCINGDCDSDADGVVDNDRERIHYGDNKINGISPAVDGDFYIFRGTAGDQIRFNVFSTSSNMDPTIEVLDPDGIRIINAVVDGASCNNVGCTFSVDLIPAITGNYSVLLYDLNTNEAGNYQFGLQCVFSPGDFVCDDITDPLPVCDNCSTISNASQLDSNADGLGNACDADLNNDGFVNFADLTAFRACFTTVDADCDFNGSGGVVNFGDLSIFRRLFGNNPGPSCVTPNNP